MKASVFLLFLSFLAVGCGNSPPPNRELMRNGGSEGRALQVVDTVPKRTSYSEWDFVDFMVVPPYFKTCPEAETQNEKKKCSDAALIKYIGENVRYPEMAKESNITGTAFVRFMVEKDGTLSGFKILRDPGGGCGEEALRVIKQMPAWESCGLEGGVPVRMQLTLPIRFKSG